MASRVKIYFNKRRALSVVLAITHLFTGASRDVMFGEKRTLLRSEINRE